MTLPPRLLLLAALLGVAACRTRGGGLPRDGAPAAVPPSEAQRDTTALARAPGAPNPPPNAAAPPASAPTPAANAAAPLASLPLVLVAEVELPGRPTRFDYQDIDANLGRLVLSHMNDAEVLFLRLADGAVLGRLAGIPVARGVAVASELGRSFVTSSPHTLVVIDTRNMTELGRTATGNGPDGVAWDAVDQIVAVSDQGDGGLSLISDAGSGRRRALKLGRETGNVVYDPARERFWITVVRSAAPDQLISVRPRDALVDRTLAVPGCAGAHGLRLHPDGASGFIACEGNHRLVQIDLETSRVLAVLPTGEDPDVLGIDAGLGWLYVAAESGDLSVFDVRGPAATLLGHDHPGEHSHSLAVDAASHRVFFPLRSGARGKPVLRIMTPTGA